MSFLFIINVYNEVYCRFCYTFMEQHLFKVTVVILFSGYAVVYLVAIL